MFLTLSNFQSIHHRNPVEEAQSLKGYESARRHEKKKTRKAMNASQSMDSLIIKDYK